MEPGVHTRADVAEDACRRHRAGGEGDESDDDPAFTPGGHVQHGHEHGEEHQ